MKWMPIVFVMLVGAGVTPCRADGSFDKEFALSVKAGRHQLTDGQKKALLKDNHPILMQMADKGTAAVIESFAGLPDASLDQLKKDTYLKWKFSALTAERQTPFRSVVQANVDMARQQGQPLQNGFSIEALNGAEVGFAVVDIPDTQQKVVSLFILWPELPNPTWVTVVNGRAAGTPSYFQAHLQRLPLLKTMPDSGLPQ